MASNNFIRAYMSGLNRFTGLLTGSLKDEDFRKACYAAGISQQLMSDIIEASGETPESIALCCIRYDRKFPHCEPLDERLIDLKNELSSKPVAEVASACSGYFGKRGVCMAMWILSER